MSDDKSEFPREPRGHREMQAITNERTNRADRCMAKESKPFAAFECSLHKGHSLDSHVAACTEPDEIVARWPVEDADE